MSNELSQVSTSILSMSSMEISELCEKEHKNVLRDIDRMFESLYPDENERDLHVLKFGSMYESEIGNGATRKSRCFNLDRYHTDVLIAGYNIKYRAAIIKRWHELEKPKSEVDLARMYLAAAIERERLALENAAKQALIEQQADFIDSHVHFPKYIKATEMQNGNYLSRSEIRAKHFPKLRSDDRVTSVLSYYKCEKALYRNRKNMVIEVFKTTDIEEIAKKFESDLEFISLSTSKLTERYRHPALPNMEIRMKVEDEASDDDGMEFVELNSNE